MKKISNKLLYLLPLLIFFMSYSVLNKINLKKLDISKEDTAINLNSVFIKTFLPSFKLMTSDLFWILTLIESDLDHYKKRDLSSWMYLRFKTITDLDPKFYNAYQLGGLYLTVIKDDLLGARDLYEKGLSYYPDDYDLLNGAGFLYAFELKDSDKAIPIFQKLIDSKKAPEFYQTILGELILKSTGDKESYKDYLLKLYENSESDFIKNRIKEKLKRIE